MKSYEIESLIKSFLLFFVLIGAIYGLFVWQSYSQKKTILNTHILQDMKIFSYDPTNEDFVVDFVPPSESTKLITLYHEPKEVYAFFHIPSLGDYLMKVIMPINIYQSHIDTIQTDLLKGAIWYLILIMFVSAVFAYYTLYPIRNALKLNKEFIKDILHDVNTPLSSIAINLKLLHKRYGKDRSFERIKSNMDTIGALRENLHSYLGEQVGMTEKFSLKSLLKERLEYFSILYPNIDFQHHVDKDIKLSVYRNAFIRIIDNLLDNAGKYHQRGGIVSVKFKNNSLFIVDTGIGIKDTKKVFQRYHKEGERGLGLGLHIVKKLCYETGITIRVKSKINNGTTIELGLEKVRVK